MNLSTIGWLGLNVLPQPEMFAMQGYAGSIAFNLAGDTIAMTSSHGGTVHVFDRTGAFLAALRQADVSGVAAAASGFLVTDGNGAVSQIEDGTLRQLQKTAVNWDNHLVVIG